MNSLPCPELQQKAMRSTRVCDVERECHGNLMAAVCSCPAMAVGYTARCRTSATTFPNLPPPAGMERWIYPLCWPEPGPDAGSGHFAQHTLPSIVAWFTTMKSVKMIAYRLRFAHFAAETCGPRRWNVEGADASFEPGMGKKGRYARAWIERRSPNGSIGAYRHFTCDRTQRACIVPRQETGSSPVTFDLVLWLHKTLDLTAAETIGW
jgi:hypothetical protein